jgi:hypothetical protein
MAHNSEECADLLEPLADRAAAEYFENPFGGAHGCPSAGAAGSMTEPVDNTIAAPTENVPPAAPTTTYETQGSVHAGVATTTNVAGGAPHGKWLNRPVLIFTFDSHNV